MEELGRRRRNNSKEKDPCKESWSCNDEPLWRIYLNSYIDREKKLERQDKFGQRQPAELTRLPDLESAQETHPPYKFLPFNTFNLGAQAQLPNRLNRQEKMRIWQYMRADPEVDMTDFAPERDQVARTDSGKWPGTWPCIDHDLAGHLPQTAKKLKGLPCQDQPYFDKSVDDFAYHKELGHARVPKFCVSLKKTLVVDRASGEHPGLVDGDYITSELTSGAEKHVYTQVCLRGTKGMHLIELSSMRACEKTYKFCFYQALVALLARTQLRYKYATSVNIDYIYDHAWMVFLHMGNINIKLKLRLDDVVVYNYKYNVELNLIQELKDVPRIAGVDWKYLEENLKIQQLKRPELMKISEELGWEKIKQRPPAPEETENIEKWFDKLPDHYHHCILRTNRFSLAFWKDGNFWYVYNPYRCDRFGYWDDTGYACITKFCSRTTLTRHLIILLVRSYVYVPSSPLKFPTNAEILPENNSFDLQIFEMIYHCVKVHNVKFLQRKRMKQKRENVWKNLDTCNYDSGVDSKDDMPNLEKPKWLKDLKISWSRALPRKGNIKRWHQYDVEESGKLFSLWAELHPTGDIFARENRGKQTYACYVVCAGMMRIVAPEYWSSRTLDVIVMCGDRYYTLSRLQSGAIASKREYDARYLATHFEIGEMLFEVKVLEASCGRLYTRDSLWKRVEELFVNYSFGVLTCENSCLAIFKFCGSYYILDVNSIGPPIFNYGDGVAYLLRATSFAKFIKTLILSIGSIECSSFALNPVDILKIIEVGSPHDINQPKKKKDDEAFCPQNKIKMKKMKRGKRVNKIVCKTSHN